MGNKPYIIRNTELRYGNTSGLMKAKVIMYIVYRYMKMEE